MEPAQRRKQQPQSKQDPMEKEPLLPKDKSDEILKKPKQSSFSLMKAARFACSYLWVLPMLIAIGGFFALLGHQLKYCGTSECGVKCMVSTTKDWEGCIAECKCYFTPPAHWLHPFRAEHSVHHHEDSTEHCPQGYASTPKLKTLQDKPQPAKKPNFVLILLDDQDEMVSPYLEAMPFTRELFEKNGTRFTQAFSSTSLCCPARCQLLTGLYGHNTGVLYNTGPYGGRRGFIHPRYTNGTRMKDEEGKCINNEYRDAASLLKENANYASGIFGKYIAGVEYGEMGAKPPGWSAFHVGSDHKIYIGYQYSLYNWTEGMENIEYEYRNFDKSDYITDVIRDRALTFIDRQRETSAEKPMFLFMAPTAPHFPLNPAPRHKHMLGYWASRYDQIVSSRPSFFNKTEILDSKSKWLKNSMDVRFNLKDHPFTKTDFVKRMTSLMAVDEMIESLYRKLESYGEANNTIFVFSSDNGYNYGSHGLAHKQTPYEESVRVPLFISGPGFPRGKNISDLTLLIDVLPTFLESSGFQVPSYMDGFSLIPTMKGSEPKLQHERKAVLLEYKGLTPYYANISMEHEIPRRYSAVNPPAGLVGQDTPPFKAIRTADHMLVDYIYFYEDDFKNVGELVTDDVDTILAKTDHEYELYDLNKDPYQMNNLFKKVGKDSDLFKKLHADLKKLQKCHGKNCYEL